MLTQIDLLKENIRNQRPLSKSELEYLKEQFIIENTYNSNAIEGNTLTLRETALILQKNITIAEKPLKDHLEAVGHKDAIYYVYDLVEKNSPISEKEIKMIHSLILADKPLDRGVYRSLPVRILGSSHIPVEPYLISKKVEELLYDYEKWKKEYHILEAIALFHLSFESIHPFIDGNGRTGRLLLNLELLKAGYLPISIKFQDQREYYSAFDDYHENEYSPKRLLDLIMRYELAELENYYKLISQSKKKDSQ